MHSAWNARPSCAGGHRAAAAVSAAQQAARGHRSRSAPQPRACLAALSTRLPLSWAARTHPPEVLQLGKLVPVGETRVLRRLGALRKGVAVLKAQELVDREERGEEEPRLRLGALEVPAAPPRARRRRRGSRAPPAKQPSLARASSGGLAAQGTAVRQAQGSAQPLQAGPL
jgi:hypothetical protein